MFLCLYIYISIIFIIFHSESVKIHNIFIWWDCAVDHSTMEDCLSASILCANDTNVKTMLYSEMIASPREGKAQKCEKDTCSCDMQPPTQNMPTVLFIILYTQNIKYIINIHIYIYPNYIYIKTVRKIKLFHRHH